jgi:segregation and condensation protein A
MDERLIKIIDKPNWKLLLFDIVKENDFNVWNIDIIKLTDLYLKKILSFKQENLLIPANALLAASILLKIKTYTLKLSSIEVEDDLIFPKEEDQIFSSLNIENPIRSKEGQVSLDDLIEAIDVIMNKPTKKNIERIIKEKAEVNFHVPSEVEDITLRIEKLYSSIKKEADLEGCLTFKKLFCENFSNYDVVNNFFIPLLFLSQDQKINVWQDDFFSEIFIKVI